MWDWLTSGPIFGGRNNPSGQPRSTGSYALQGARIGAAAGPFGAALGSLAGWIYGRSQQNQGTMDPNATAMGPPSSLAGDPMGQFAGPPADMAGDPYAWSNDTTMSASDDLGLVPDYNQGGDTPNFQTDSSPQERRDMGIPSGYSQFSPGTTLYQGVLTTDMGNDPNGSYVFNNRDFD